MKSEDWLIRAFANDEIPKKVKVMWDVVVWGAMHIDKIPKIMGRVSSEASERDELREFLYDEHKYELFVAMVYAEICDERQKKGKFSDQRMDFEPAEKSRGNRVFQKLVQGQLFSFLRWCDEKDCKELFEGRSALAMYRLCYIATSLGYRKLALFFIGKMGKEQVKEGGIALDKYENQLKLLQRKWICDFYRKQPEGKNKNKLAKRIVRDDSLRSMLPLKKSI